MSNDRNHHSSIAAFSLLELSIVLVIIGLLSGGILGGQALIRASELRSVTNDLSNVQIAINGFRDKYFAMPGDMNNATQFWGIDTAGGSTTGNDDNCYTHPSTTIATCNGNGDTHVDMGYSATTYAERGRFWQHLANAGLIEGQYTGYQGLNSAPFRVGGLNAKASRLGTTHYNIGYVAGITAANGNYFPINDGNIIELVPNFTTLPEPSRTILGADEQWNIDTKLDDGQPALGIIRGPKQGNQWTANCTNGTTTTAQYSLNVSGKICYLWLLLK